MRVRAGVFSVLLLSAAAALSGCDSAEERAAEHYESGMALLEEGQPAKAQLEFRNAIQLNPEHARARYELAQHLKNRGDVRGAVNQLRSVVEIDQDHQPALIDLAEIMLVANQLERAERYVERAVEIDPSVTRLRAIKASVDYKQGRRDPAVEMAREVIEEQPDNVTARLVLVADAMDDDRLNAALELLDEGLALKEDDLSLNVIRLGVLEDLEKTDEIGAQLERMVEHFPNTDQFRQALARWYVFKKRYDDAEAQYRAIAENNPGDHQKALDVARFVNSVHGPEAAREELLRLAQQPDALVEYDLAIAALDMRQGREDDAIARLDRVIEEQGMSLGGHKARLERAKIHVRKEEFAAADALLGTVIEDDRKNSQALLLRASRYLAEDKVSEAISDLRSALDVAPDNVQVMLTLASAYERNGNQELALERLGQAVQASDYEPDVALRYMQALVAADKLNAAESVLRDTIKRKGETRELLLALARLKLRQSEWDAATRIAGQLRVIDPEDEAADRIIAAAALGLRKFDEGADILADLVEKEVESGGGAQNVVSLVRVLLAGGDTDRALSFLNTRLEETPDDATALVLRASIVASQGDLEEAEADLKRAIEAEPGNAAAYASLARIYNSLGRESEVSETLEKGLAINAKDPALRLTQAMQLEHEGQYDEAIAVYEELYKERPNSTVIANNFASLLADHRSDDPEQIERAYNIAKRFRQSDQPYLQDTYGWLLHLRGDSEAAASYVMEAADALATNPVVQYHAGVVLTANGQLAQARQYINRALELSDQVRFAH
ncbi:MAG: tetratricopeptide repeat protein, partial [Pseudomonadota bacterium]